jgi:hypothetical protein
VEDIGEVKRSRQKLWLLRVNQKVAKRWVLRKNLPSLGMRFAGRLALPMMHDGSVTDAAADEPPQFFSRIKAGAFIYFRNY